jgi:putative transposase
VPTEESPIVLIQRGYKTELDLNNQQITLAKKHAGAARLAWNWGLDQKKQALQNKTPAPSAIDLHRQINLLKKTDYPWAYEVSKCAFQESLRNLDRAFNNFWKSRKGQRKGKRVGFPRFKSKRAGLGTFRLTGTIKVFEDSIQLPRLGILHLKERDYLPQDCKILSATISEKAGRWFVSIQVEIEQPEYDGQKDVHDVVGIDLGIKTLATCSDGQVFENPKPLKRGLKKIKRFARYVSRKIKGSKNRKKTADRLSRLHARVANIRRDTLHKMTTTLAKTKRVIGIEDLNISGMMKNHCLAQAISDLGLFEWRRQLTYKAAWYGCRIVVADRFFPSSKRCHECSAINSGLTLSDRNWACMECGVIHDRDFNASMNLEHVAVSSTETQNARGETSSGVVARPRETGFVEAGNRQVFEHVS